MKISQALREKTLLSFELFPPKTEKGMENLPGTMAVLAHKDKFPFCRDGHGDDKVGDGIDVERRDFRSVRQFAVICVEVDPPVLDDGLGTAADPGFDGYVSLLPDKLRRRVLKRRRIIRVLKRSSRYVGSLR